ncbi:MAG: hypothetical protein JJU11_07665 [Candidatus Sumerlaeia bacterium]|nr:hypothetical protein [Candidatus Sumerlaeia bacterium]
MTNEAPPTHHLSNGPGRRSRALVFMEWLPILPLLIFVPLFLLTSIPRILTPFELEWNEGHSAEQAWRFAMGLPLYPGPEEDWVPYMYAPLYHVLHGWIMWLTGVWSLAWGRVISLVSTAFILQGIFLIVYNQSRRWVPSLAATLLFLAYYKPTGFWYDIVRVDSFSLALAVWGMYFTLKRAPRPWEAVVGLGLLALATWTKQTHGFLAVACAGWILFRQPRATILACFAIALVTINATYLFMRGGSDHFLKYAYTNALNHPSLPHVWFPGYLYPADFLREAGNPEGLLARTSAYIRLWRELGAPTVWTDCLRHAWLPLLLIAAWLIAALVGRKRPRGVHYLVPCLLMAFFGLESFAKYGGYINNFMAVYLAVAIAFGLGLAGLTRSIRGRPWRAGLGVAVFVIVALQMFQPWNIPAAGYGPANNMMVLREHDPERREELRNWTNHLNNIRAAREGGWEYVATPPEVSFRIRLRHLLGRINHGGLTWFPSHQQPAPGSQEVYEGLLDWLMEKNRAGEPVLVMHHQWYGILTGHALSVNIDMLRCAHWAGDPIPTRFINDLRGGRWPHLVLGAMRVEWDWMAGPIGDIINQHYEYVGTTPPLEGHEHTRAFIPVTGAEVRPLTHWKYRGRQY